MRCCNCKATPPCVSQWLPGPISPSHPAFLLAGLLCSLRPGPTRGPSPTEPPRPGTQCHPSRVGPRLRLGPQGLAPSVLPPGLAGRRWEGLHGHLPGPRADLRALLLPLPQQPGRLPEVSEPPPGPPSWVGPAHQDIHPVPSPACSGGGWLSVLVSQGGSEGPSSQLSMSRLPHSWQSLNPKAPGKLTALLHPSLSLLPSLAEHLLGLGHESCPQLLLMGQPASRPPGHPLSSSLTAGGRSGAAPSLSWQRPGLSWHLLETSS